MQEIATIVGGSLSGVLHGTNLELGKPFSQQIYLGDLPVAGTTHIDNIKEIEPKINLGAKLQFFREPDNSFDSLAVAVYCNDQKIGFIPRKKNEIIARLLDAGKLLYGIVQQKEFEKNWLKITLQIYLDD